MISTYHLEAAIAYEYCVAKSYESTNWQAILGYYDTLLVKSFNPIVFLNRSIVLMKLEGPQKAYALLSEIKNNKQLEKYYLYYAILGELHQRLGRKSEAVDCFQKALKLTLSNQERYFLKNKISEI